MKKQTTIDVQLIKVMKEIDKALLILGKQKLLKSEPITQIPYKIKVLVAEYYAYKRLERLKGNLSHSNYSKYPYKGIEDNGYVMLYTPSFTPAISEHRMVVQEHLGRKLFSSEIVHHKDYNKANNDINNLQVVSRMEHIAIHRKKKDDL
jgi:hypothetical protein